MLETLFSSRVRAKLLKEFFLSPGVERNAWELSHSLKENYSAVWKELNRLEGVGLLTSQQRGNTKDYQVNTASPIAPELRSIVIKTEGIGDVIRNRLNELGKIQKAFIYGSYASGMADQNSDIDLMVIGDVNLEEFAQIISEEEKELNRALNYVIYSQEEWDEKLAKEEPFAVNVKQSPKIMLVGGEDAL
jgi:predicted nucleotidyltransferase